MNKKHDLFYINQPTNTGNIIQQKILKINNQNSQSNNNNNNNNNNIKNSTNVIMNKHSNNKHFKSEKEILLVNFRSKATSSSSSITAKPSNNHHQASKVASQSPGSNVQNDMKISNLINQNNINTKDTVLKRKIAENSFISKIQQQQQQLKPNNNNKVKIMSNESAARPQIVADFASTNSCESIIELEIVDRKSLTSQTFEEQLKHADQCATNETISASDFSLTKCSNDDLVSLNNLNEANVLEQLKKRFVKNLIYTYIGDILIAMNPLKAIGIYGKHISNLYQKCDNVREKLPPHVFATAEQCFREMIRTQQSQCILISGESGSGKTETCKYLVQHLLNRTKPFEFCLNAKIQEVNPLLEAFGNAKTRINDNSSRFGKYLEIYFEQDGTVVGAKFKEYLLEKSRIVYQNEYESTFHIFYLLFAGLTDEEKVRYGLAKSAKRYRFMSNTNLDNCMCMENQEKFLAIRKSLETIGFLEDDIENLIKVLISILLIGEIQFVQKKGNNSDAVQVKNMEIIENVCDLLELEAKELNDALVSDVQITRGEEIKRERNMVQVCDVRDALAKAFYGRLFSWIVNQINHHIQPAEGVDACFSIGLLDIFGFENFEKNSFEQMCINLANEQLHQLFAKYIFKLEIQECLDEQVELNNSDLITFQDNQNILDLFLEKRMGIFALLDEESRFPKATDQSLAIKLHQTLSPLYSDVYIAPKNVGTSFSIVHYAGQVLYNVDGFLEKNRDFLPNNLFYAARNSNNFLVQELFQCKLTRKGTIAPSDRQSKLRKSMANLTDENGHIVSNNQATSSSSEISILENNISASRVKFAASISGTSLANSLSANFINKNEEFRNSIVNNQYASDKALPLTVACHFKNSLHELIEKINKCKAYFIRCIKPNPNQENVFLNEFVVKQLRYCSLMHVCKIRKCGFPYRIQFDEFLKWYKAIEICILKREESSEYLDLNNNVYETLQKCLKCLEYAQITNYKVGKSKLFLRYWHIDILNSLAKKLENKVLIAQKVTRGWLVRKRFKKLQQEHQMKQIFNQISIKSQNLIAKLNYQRSFEIETNELYKRNNVQVVVQNEPSESIEVESQMKSFTAHDERAQIKSKHQTKKSNLKQQQQLNNLNSKMNQQITGNELQQNWPDIKEINMALEEFDTMLHEYEIDLDQKENKQKDHQQIMNKKMNNKELSRSNSSFNNNMNNNHHQQQQQQQQQIHHNNHNNVNIHVISPTSVYHLVNNNNNKNDNTLKKRNALVAFEFKTLLDKVAPPSYHNLIETSLIEEKIQEEILPSPPYIYSDNYELNNCSPSPSSSSSSSSSPKNISSSSSSSSSSNKTNNQSSKQHQNSTANKAENHSRAISPSQIIQRPRYGSQINNQNGKSNLLTELNSETNRQTDQQQQNLRSKSQVIPILPSNNRKTEERLNEHTNAIVLNANSTNNNSNNNLNNNHNVTIWREELNAKNNVQQQIKKQTELSQKVEDSKKNIPEWKKNLLKQKELKKNILNTQQNTANNGINNIPETPELMKHNMFLKKQGLASHF